MTREQVLDFSPTLADKRGIVTENRTMESTAIDVLREIPPDIYEKHPRSELERLASGEAMKDLQRDLQQAKEELSEFRCPFCGAPLAERGGEWVGPRSDHFGIHEIFECGYRASDGRPERPCPSDPTFPRFEDYELQFRYNPAETHHPWLCRASPKTKMARRLALQPGAGRTKEEAERQLRERYERHATKRNT